MYVAVRDMNFTLLSDSMCVFIEGIKVTLTSATHKTLCCG